jgi:hypothetical protein
LAFILRSKNQEHCRAGQLNEHFRLLWAHNTTDKVTAIIQFGPSSVLVNYFAAIGLGLERRVYAGGVHGPLPIDINRGGPSRPAPPISLLVHFMITGSRYWLYIEWFESQTPDHGPGRLEELDAWILYRGFTIQYRRVGLGK